MEDVVIAIEQKWPKNGPWYSLSIDEEGNVEYDGINNVKMLGKHSSTVKKEELNELVNTAISIYFFSLRDKYGDISQYPDSCQTTITISEKKYKKITYLNESRVPRDLLWLVKKIEMVTNVSRWTGSL